MLVVHVITKDVKTIETGIAYHSFPSKGLSGGLVSRPEWTLRMVQLINRL